MITLKGKDIKSINSTDTKNIMKYVSFMERREEHLRSRIKNTDKNLTYDRLECEAITETMNVVRSVYDPPFNDADFKLFWQQFFMFFIQEAKLDLTNEDNLQLLVSQMYTWIRLTPWYNNITVDDVLEDLAEQTNESEKE